jgi:hypothetical protein
MKVIPLKNITLFVLETVVPIKENMTIEICKTCRGEIVVYAKFYIDGQGQVFTEKDLDDFIDQPEIPSWWINTYNSMIKARKEMQKHLRENRIDDLLKSDDPEEFMWA